jgi:hypothetical protein
LRITGNVFVQKYKVKEIVGEELWALKDTKFLNPNVVEVLWEGPKREGTWELWVTMKEDAPGMLALWDRRDRNGDGRDEKAQKKRVAKQGKQKEVGQGDRVRESQRNQLRDQTGRNKKQPLLLAGYLFKGATMFTLNHSHPSFDKTCSSLSL